MIGNDEFHRTMMDGFKEIRAKMDDLHKETMDKVDEIEDKVNNLESSYNTHIKVGEALTKQKTKTKLTKSQKIMMSLAVIPIIIATITIALI